MQHNMERVWVLVGVFNWCSPLVIQKVSGGGRPGGGLQSRTSGEPSVTTTGSSTSLGHKGASEGWRWGRWVKESREVILDKRFRWGSVRPTKMLALMSYHIAYITKSRAFLLVTECQQIFQRNPSPFCSNKFQYVRVCGFLLETRSRILLDRATPNSLLAKHWYSPS